MEFFQERTRVRLRSRDYGACLCADEGGEEIIVVHRDDETLDEARPRAADCLVRGGNRYILSNGAGVAYDQNLGQIVNGDSPGGHERSDAVQRTNDTPEQDEFFANRTRVWLWIREYGAYQFSGDDGEAIAGSQNLGMRHGASAAAHRLLRDGTDLVLFHSASYSRYLSQNEDEVGEEDDCLLVQRTHDPPEQDNMLFQGFRAEDGSGDIFISKFMVGDWCHPDDEDMPLRWVFEAIPPRLLPPEAEVLHPIRVNPAELKDGPSVPLYRRLQLMLPRVLLRRRRTIDQGHYNPLEWRFLQFDGRAVFNLRRDLAAELGEADNVLGMKIVVLTTGPPEFMRSTWVASKERLTPVTYDQPMDTVSISSVSQKTDDTYNIRPSTMRFHGVPSQITERQIFEMYNFLIYVGDQYFLDAFIGCLEPIDEDQLEEHTTYKEFLGNPLQQTVPGTCAIVSSTKCVEMQHRWKYDKYYGLGTFPCQVAAPRKLRSLCRREKVWSQSDGAYVGDVMDTIMLMGGIRTTNASTPAPYLLPLQSWERHGCDIGDGLTANQIMDLLDLSGPFVGTMWVCPWYSLFDANEDDDLVYRSGCARSLQMQERSQNHFRRYEVSVGLHSVVCFAYRLTDGGELHVRTLDNHTVTGPERWIHYSELQEVHTVSVERLDPPVHLGRRVIVYPRSSYI